MCTQCDMHRARATQQRAMAERSPPAYRHAHLELARLHEARIVDHHQYERLDAA